LCYTTPREALLSSIFRLISVLHPSVKKFASYCRQ
jgi:hypothetical protein